MPKEKKSPKKDTTLGFRVFTFFVFLTTGCYYFFEAPNLIGHYFRCISYFNGNSLAEKRELAPYSGFLISSTNTLTDSGVFLVNDITTKATAKLSNMPSVPIPSGEMPHQYWSGVPPMNLK